MLIVIKNGARAFGGALRLMVSVLHEMLVSALLAPIRMLFHTQFVAAALFGRSVQWKSPPREDVETTWSEALRRHGGQTLLGIAWVGGVYWLDPAHVWWLLPVAGALILSMPVSVLLSRARLGRRLRRLGLFLIPEESSGSPEIRQTAQWTRAYAQRNVDFVAAVLDPLVNARACAIAPHGHRAARPLRPGTRLLVRHALVHGPDALSAREKMTLLDDARLLGELHRLVTSSEEAASAWRPAAARATSPATPDASLPPAAVQPLADPA